jgi:hypothetical protein
MKHKLRQWLAKKMGLPVVAEEAHGHQNHIHHHHHHHHHTRGFHWGQGMCAAK